MSLMKHSFDEEIMLKAIELGESSRSLAPPNPWVGCIIVKNGLIIGRGATQKTGGAHAEIVALEEAGKEAEGSTLYVTLEPCCHHGRTPPCVEKIKNHRVAKVIIALKDPDKRVDGKGIHQLQEAGIEVVTGICTNEALFSLEPYLFQRKMQRPFVVAKCACSLDGRIAAKDSSSKWISSEAARHDAQELRRQSQAILIGAGTAMHDLPRLTIRNSTTQALRVVLDSKGRLEAKGPLFDISLAPTLIFTTNQASREKIHEWQSAGAQVEVIKSDAGGVHLQEVMEKLYTRGILQVLCEGGGILFGNLLRHHFVNRFTAYVSPCLLGDEGKPMLQGLNIAAIADSYKLNFLSTKILDGTIRIDYAI